MTSRERRGMTAILIAVALATLDTAIANTAHMLIYGIPFDVRLSAAERIRPLAAFAAPMLAGLALGSVDAWRTKRRSPAPVDPVEANALRGGRMALSDSLLVAAQTVTSNGCGASVGLEGGYTQIGAGVASKLGVDLHLRRQDLIACDAVERRRHGTLLDFSSNDHDQIQLSTHCSYARRLQRSEGRPDHRSERRARPVRPQVEFGRRLVPPQMTLDAAARNL